MNLQLIKVWKQTDVATEFEDLVGDKSIDNVNVLSFKQDLEKHNALVGIFEQAITICHEQPETIIKQIKNWFYGS